MIPSGGEVAAQARRAARGAGLSWAMADEAGRAVRWLAGHGLPGLEALAGLLGGKAAALGRPPQVGENGRWTVERKCLCPLATGAALADLGLEAGGVTTEAVARPLLLLPFLRDAATGGGLTLSWDGARAWSDGETLVVEADAVALRARETPAVEVLRAARPDAIELTAVLRRPVDDKIWQALSDLGARTFAPATDASRLKGAGAGLSDND